MRDSRKSGFTLAEVLLAIALIALSAGLVIGGLNLNSESFESRPPDRVLFSAVKRARIASIESGCEVFLRFDKRGFFEISEGRTGKLISNIYLEKKLERAVEEAEKKSEDMDWDAYPNDVSVEFEAVEPELVRRSSVQFADLKRSFITFWPDSTMTPVRAIVSIGTNACASVVFDPFCAAPKGDENAR